VFHVLYGFYVLAFWLSKRDDNDDDESWLMPQPPHHLRNDLKCVEWDVKPCSTQPNPPDDDDDDVTVQVLFSFPSCHAVDWKAFIIAPRLGDSDLASEHLTYCPSSLSVNQQRTPGQPASCLLAGRLVITYNCICRRSPLRLHQPRANYIVATPSGERPRNYFIALK